MSHDVTHVKEVETLQARLALQTRYLADLAAAFCRARAKTNFELTNFELRPRSSEARVLGG